MPIKDLIIEAPRQGVAQSPHVGFGDIRNLDISSVPGVVKLNNILTKRSTTVVDAHVNWLARDPDNADNVFALDSNGVLYKYVISTDTLTEISDRDGVGQGLAVMWGYVFVFEVTTIDVVKISDSSVTSNWQTIGTDSLWHPTYVSKNDGKIYFGCGRYLGSIEQNSGQTFDPATGATYTVTLGTSANNCLDLPASYRIKCIEELGNNLMLGTWQGTNVYDIRIADIFPWDRSSASFGQPIVLNEYGIHAMKNIGNSLVVLAGTTGTIYRCDGSNAYIIGKLPIDLSGGKYIEFYPGALTYYKNKIFFGVGHTALTVGSVATTIAGMGVYSLNQTGQGSILNYEHFSSAETDGSAAAVKYSALLPLSDETLLVGWRSNTTYGVDLTNSASYAYTTNYTGAYFDSPLYVVGTNLNLRAFTQLEFQLAKELATGEGIQVKFRVNLTDSWTTIGTYTYAILGAVTSHNTSVNIPACEMLQIRCEFLGTSTTTPQFKSLTLR